MDEVTSRVVLRERRATRAIAVAQTILQLAQVHDAITHLASAVAFRGESTHGDAPTQDGAENTSGLGRLRGLRRPRG